VFILFIFVYLVFCVLVCLCYDYFVLSVLVQLITWEDRRQNNLLCVERDVKPLLTHSLSPAIHTDTLGCCLTGLLSWVTSYGARFSKKPLGIIDASFYWADALPVAQPSKVLSTSFTNALIGVCSNQWIVSLLAEWSLYRPPLEVLVLDSHYISRESWTMRNVYWSRTSVCVSVCDSMLTLLHGPKCNLGNGRGCP